MLVPFYPQTEFRQGLINTLAHSAWAGLAPKAEIFFSSDDPEKKICLYIALWINGKF